MGTHLDSSNVRRCGRARIALDTGTPAEELNPTSIQIALKRSTSRFEKEHVRLLV